MRLMREWVDEHSLAIQGTLATIVRGPDNSDKESTAKPLVRALRYTFMNNAHDIEFNHHDKFMGDHTGLCDPEQLEYFIENHDAYSHHWLMHFIHAAEIIGYLHPDRNISQFWRQFYFKMCDSMHMLYESKNEMLDRLAEKRVK